MKTTCPVCGLKTITLTECGRFVVATDHPETWIDVAQDCFCFITTEQADELEARYDPEEANRQHQPAWELVEL
jgi:hypothetical protein